MSDVKWIKIMTDIFNDEKILMIETLPSADSMIVIWFKLLCFAGQMNNDGVFMMKNRVAYTDEMLAAIFRRDVNTVRMSLNVFEQYGMIEIVDSVITIPNWNKHQTLDAYDKKKERDRVYQAERRAKQRALIEKSSDCHAIESSYVAVSEEDKEIDKDKDKDIKIDYKSIVELFNSTCTSFPHLKSLSDARKKAIKARLNTYSVDDFKTMFQKAEASSFLKGANDKNWTASFDWMIKDANMAKVLDGNYDNRTSSKPVRKTNSFNNFHQRQYDFEAMERMNADRQNPPKNDDPEFLKRKEALQARLQDKYKKG